MTHIDDSDSEKQVFVPIEGQSFDCQQRWINRASSWLTNHPKYFNAESSDLKGWRGHHFTAMCFDQLGRRCKSGGDFQRAKDDDAYPIYWIWPDQIVDLIQSRQALKSEKSQ